MKRILTAIIICIVAAAHAPAQKPLAVDIWPEGLPNSNGTDLTEPYSDETRNYKPTMYVYLPDSNKATGRAVLALPGGGYVWESFDNEGHSRAKPLNDRGIALIVVKYRLPRNRMLAVPETDVYEAIRITRRHAREWHIDPHKVGVMGHSAGGHLAATVATLAEGDARPDFQILFYPVITMDKRYTHMGTHDNLIGKDPQPEIADYYSCEKQVQPGDAPALILVTDDDTVGPSENSVSYYLALQKAGVSASLHVYPAGEHGFSNHKTFRSHDVMLDDLFSWIDSLK